MDTYTKGTQTSEFSLLQEGESVYMINPKINIDVCAQIAMVCFFT